MESREASEVREHLGHTCVEGTGVELEVIRLADRWRLGWKGPGVPCKGFGLHADEWRVALRGRWEAGRPGGLVLVGRGGFLE